MLRWDYFEFIKGVCLLCDLMGMRARIQVLEMVAHESWKNKREKEKNDNDCCE